jgi:hypothetical protein
MKIFDYKFLLTLGLCLIVYFLYREIDILTKRVATLEQSKEKNNIELINLPPPPSETNNEIIMKQIILDKSNAKQTEQQMVEKQMVEQQMVEQQMVEQQMVEEYSNDNNVNIYSHDNLHTNTNDHDTLMVESILNMVKDELDNNNIIEIDVNIEPVVSTNEVSEHNVHIVDKHNNEVEEPTLVEHIEESDNDSDMVLIKENTSNKLSLESLNKKKLDELQELASKYNIEINNENGKKKKKADLAEEIFNKQ